MLLVELDWSMGGEASLAAQPLLAQPAISFVISRKDDFPARKIIEFDTSAFRWTPPKDRPTIPGLIVYARVDGSFAVWDPARHFEDIERESTPGVFLFTRDDHVLNGLENKIGACPQFGSDSKTRRTSPFSKCSLKYLVICAPPDMETFVTR